MSSNTPVEIKAKELFEKYSILQSNVDYRINNWDLAKYSALICVDEIIETCPQKENEIFGISKGIEYWQSVKSAIEKL